MISQVAVGNTRGSASPLGHALVLVGDMWAVRILRAVYNGCRRFQELREMLTISDPVLARRLRTLIADGLIEAREYQSKPPRQEYDLTGAGGGLWQVLVAMWDWDVRHAGTAHPDTRTELQHLTCGHQIRPVFTCGRCGAGGLTVRDVVGSVEERLLADVTDRRSRRSPAMSVPIDSAGVLGDRWSTMILSAAFLGSRRYSDFRTRLDISPVTLTQRLGLFVDAGIFCRESVVTGGKRQEYRMTPKGADFFVVTTMINAWAQRWLAAGGSSGLALVHRACGHELAPHFTCDMCHRRLTRGEVRFEPPEPPPPITVP
ncbi:helix-turn-helix domain-containing protein [Micromonospora sp. WMMA1363]|uniref:winged helix-turn-helix transcriptional regulator n=1 Tax=Micromonospora sp. WMMA1363 TaxID=3053985 RepID=UPI00259C8876|nr:helix-turn-helix domain-containing protein [Micromonospora sp. WMMA1363]MDM4719527.1 helix-turn-helix domain-containing protein [Micromonospora sp. WMMA1363]